MDKMIKVLYIIAYDTLQNWSGLFATTIQWDIYV